MKKKPLLRPIELTVLLIITFLLSGSTSGFLNAQPVSITDSLALVDLFNSTGGNDWNNKTGWLTNPVKQWAGISLIPDGSRVRLISLANNGLEGSIPESIGNLSQLETLDLERNRLGGPIPATIGNLIKLKYLRLTSNQLTGPIPASVGLCTELINLYLPGNKLSGNIPAEIGNLTSLTQLKLFMNQLSGEVPSSIVNMSALQILELNSNLLEGSFPPFPASVTKLDINNNRLTGIPDMTGNLPALKILYIQANTLSFNEIDKVYLLGITTINYQSQWRFPVEIAREGPTLNLTMKNAGKVKTWYRWFRNGALVYTGADSTYRITQAEAGDRFWAEARSNQIHFTTLTSDTVTISDPVVPVKRYVINSNADRPLAANAPDGVCTTGDSIMVDGIKVPECTYRAAIEMVNKVLSASRTEFTFNMQQGAVILPQSPLPAILFPTGLDGSTQPGGLVFLKGTGVENTIQEPSIAINLLNTGNSFIFNFSVEDFGYGICLEQTNDTEVRECRFLNNTLDAIYVHKSERLTLLNNFVKDQFVGFRINDSEQVTIQGNTIKTYTDFSQAAGGVKVRWLRNSRISNNEVSMDRGSYKDLLSGITISSSESILIDSNHIHSCPGGIFVILSKNLEINDNFLVNNERNITLINHQVYDSSNAHNVIARNVIGIGPDGTPGTFDKYGIYLEESNSDVILGNLIAFQNEYGIYGKKVFNGYFRANTIGSETSVAEGNGKGGIKLSEAFYTRITDNVISGNKGHGIDCREGFSISIIDNYIGTEKGLNSVIGNSGNGILLSKAINPVIRGNQIHGNAGSGLVIEDGNGICIVEFNNFGKQGFDNFGNKTKGINIKGNNISLFGNYVLDQSSSHGIYLERNHASAPDQLQVHGNIVLNNQFGMLLKDFRKGQVTANTIMYNYSSGLTILGKESALTCELNTIEENGGGTGIHVTDASATIRGNSIKSDETDGIAIEGDGQILISGNNISGNTLTGVRNTSTTSVADARGNWWGHAGGPGGQGTGNGDAVSANVLFDPWKTAPAGVTLAAVADTIIIRPGVRDSVILFFADWIDPAGNLEVSISDSLGWSGSHNTSLIINLRGTEVNYLTLGLTTEAADIGKINKIKVTARSASDSDNSDTLVICIKTEAPRLSFLNIMPGFAELRPGDTVRFTLLALDQYFNLTDAEVIWQAEGGTISADRIFTAGETPGSYNIIARHPLSGITDTAFVNILHATAIKETLSPQTEPRDILIYPNPSGGMVNIRFQTNQYGDALIMIHSLNGTLVKVLRTIGLPPATHEIGIDLLSLQGGGLPDGVYLVSVTAGHTRKTGRVILIR